MIVFKLFLMGYSTGGIADKMTELGFKTASELDHWHPATVDSVLTNEKYKGDALLQKQYMSDFLQKKRKKNMGEVAQYYADDHHEASIDPGHFRPCPA